MLVICDIDGTIADIVERQKRAGQAPDKKNKRKFQNWLNKLQPVELLAKDRPIVGMRELLHALADNHKLVYVTGRSEKYRKVTDKWLADLHFPAAPLKMRPDKDDETATDQLKERVMLDLAIEYQDFVILVLDDDVEGVCEAMYRKHGWTHLKATANLEDAE